MSAPSAEEPPQTPTQSSTQTCTGSLGITCDIDENLDIVRTGGGTLFRRRLKDLVVLFTTNRDALEVQTYVQYSFNSICDVDFIIKASIWFFFTRDQDETHKKFVIEQREFGTGWQTKSILKELSALLQHREGCARCFRCPIILTIHTCIIYLLYI